MIDSKWFPLQGPESFLKHVLHLKPAPPLIPEMAQPPEGPAPMPPTPEEQTAQIPAATAASTPSVIDQIEAAGKRIIAQAATQAEAEAEPIAEALVDELLGKIPLGTMFDPLAHAVLTGVASKLTAKLAAI